MAKENIRRASWLQLDVPHELACEVRRLQSLISSNDIVEMEDDPHVTVLYGLQTDDPAEVAVKLSDCGEVHWLTGVIDVFANRFADVLYINVISRELSPLHYKLRQRFYVTGEYRFRPHVTIAKVKPGRASTYTNFMRRSGAAAPFPIISRTIVFHTRDRKRYEIGLEE